MCLLLLALLLLAPRLQRTGFIPNRANCAYVRGVDNNDKCRPHILAFEATIVYRLDPATFPNARCVGTTAAPTATRPVHAENSPSALRTPCPVFLGISWRLARRTAASASVGPPPFVLAAHRFKGMFLCICVHLPFFHAPSMACTAMCFVVGKAKFLKIRVCTCTLVEAHSMVRMVFHFVELAISPF